MRTAPAERQQAEQVLQDEGWTSVKILKNLMRVEPSLYQAMAKWCEDHIGSGRLEPGHNWLDEEDVWYSFTWYGYWTFHFKHAKDATAFALRWT